MRKRRASSVRLQDLLLDEGCSSEHHRSPDATPTADCTRCHARVFAVAGDRHVPALAEQRCISNSKLYRSEPRCCLCLDRRLDHDNRGRHGSGHSPGSSHNGGPFDNSRSAPGTDHHHNNNPATCHATTGADRQCRCLAESVGARGPGARPSRRDEAFLVCFQYDDSRHYHSASAGDDDRGSFAVTV